MRCWCSRASDRRHFALREQLAIAWHWLYSRMKKGKCEVPVTFCIQVQIPSQCRPGWHREASWVWRVQLFCVAKRAASEGKQSSAATSKLQARSSTEGCDKPWICFVCVLKQISNFFKPARQNFSILIINFPRNFDQFSSLCVVLACFIPQASMKRSATITTWLTPVPQTNTRETAINNSCP